MARTYIAEAQVQAESMVSVAERLHPGSVERLRVDPIAELHRWNDLSLNLISEAGSREDCSVAGSYRPTPPTLFVTQSKSIGRQNFTALHELGHHLQQTDIALGNAVFQHGDPDQFEEQSCDAFAARILLPDQELASTLDPRGPSAQDVVDLFTTRSSASREACCVWAARHLRGSGAVVLLDATGVVLFAATNGFVPPARRSDQSRTPLIEAALASRSNGATRDDTYVTYRNGGQSDTVFGQARWFDNDYLVAVLVTDNAPWMSLSLPRPSTWSEKRQRFWVCETCTESFPVDDKCARCADPRCPNGHCGCHAARASMDKQCIECFQILAPSRFSPGSSACKDCAD